MNRALPRVVGRALAAALCALLALTGCATDRDEPPVAPPAGANDINPKPRELVRDGGELRWPISTLPDNYNIHHFLGARVDTESILAALMPNLFLAGADDQLRPNPNYLVSAEVTSTNPQIVRYVIRPEATWSDGTPITWRDFFAQWKARNGSNPEYQIVSRTGYEDIASIRPGGPDNQDDRTVVVTFARPFAEWQGLFSPLYPASTNNDPAVFNTGWLHRIRTTAGPFEPESIDRATKTVTLRRDPDWWGPPAKLDRIIFKVYDRAAQADALANNEIDFYRIGSSVDLLRRAQQIPGVVVRQSPERQYNHITFNGAPGTLLADARLRRAIAKGIDRAGIATRLVGQIVPDPRQSGNHIYPYGSAHYQDNSAVLPYDPASAARELDALGWAQPAPGATRVKDGQKLRLRLVEPAPNPIGELIDRAIVEQLAQIGVEVVIEPVPIAQATHYYKTGDFDLVGFAWQHTATPFSSSRSLYAEPRGDDVQQNYGRVYNPEIIELFDRGIRELDDTKRADIGNQLDQLIWREVHHLPLYPGTGAVAVRSTLANFGAFGFADTDYINAGYVK